MSASSPVRRRCCSRARRCDGRRGRTAVFAHGPSDWLRVRRRPAQHRLRPAVAAVRSVSHIRMDLGCGARRLRRGAVCRRGSARTCGASVSACSQANLAFAVLVAVVLVAGWLPLTAVGVRVDDRVHRRHVGLRLRPVPRGAPSGVTPSDWSGVAVDQRLRRRLRHRLPKETHQERNIMTAITTPRLKESRLIAALRDARRRDPHRAHGIAGIPLAGWLAEVSGTTRAFEYSWAHSSSPTAVGVFALAARPSVTQTGIVVDHRQRAVHGREPWSSFSRTSGR